MTKEEAVKAAAMGVPVVYMDPMTERQTVYRRISAVIWRYATLDNVLDAKSVYVELLPDNGSRSSAVVPLDRVEIANRELALSNFYTFISRCAYAAVCFALYYNIIIFSRIIIKNNLAIIR